MIRYAFRKLEHGSLMSIIIVIQLALSLVTLNQSQYISQNYRSSVSQIQKVFGDIAMCRIRDQSDEATLVTITANEADVTSRQNELYDWLKTNQLFEYICYQEYSIDFYENDYIDERFVYSYSENGNISMKAFRMDADFQDMFPIEIETGRIFVDKDFLKNDQLHVILGYNYKKYYELNDVIEIPSNMLQPASSLKVIGFAKQNSYIANPSTPEGVLLADDYIIYPYIAPDAQSTFYDYDMQIFQSIIIPVDYAATRAAIQNKSRELGLYEVELTKPISKSQNYINMINKNNAIVFVAIIVVAMFAGLTIVSGLMYRYRLHIRDYAKFMLFGAKPYNLASEFAFETLIYVMISNVLAVTIACFSVSLYGKLLLTFDLIIVLMAYMISLIAINCIKLSASN